MSKDSLDVTRRVFLGGIAVSAAGLSLGSEVSPRAATLASPYAACDVVVVGGGPAGVCAAIAAARQGVKVLVVERGNCLGGMATQGVVGPFMTCFDKSGERQVVLGLFEEIVGRLVACGGAIHPKGVRAGTPYSAWIDRGHDHVTPFDPDKLKFVLDDLCAEAGVEVLYHADFVRPLMNGDCVTGVELLTRAGLQTIAAKVVVDATGDGDVAFCAGASCVLGDPKRGGAMQPATTFFRIAGLPRAVLEDDYRAHGGSMENRLLSWYVREAVKAGEWHIPRKHVNLYLGVRDDEWFVNVSRLNGVDATDPKSLAKAEAEGRRQVREVLTLLRKHLPGGENIRLASLASTLGVRESRHVLGDVVLDKDDILEGRVPDDTIACCAYAIDLHGGKGETGTLFLTVKDGEFYGIPYRALVPRKVENLLVAGRCISATSMAAASLRVMPSAMATGEAAGMAAALAVRDGVSPRRVDVAQLRDALQRARAFVGAGAVAAPRRSEEESVAFDENLAVLIADLHVSADDARLEKERELHLHARDWLKRRVDGILAMRPRPRNVIVLGDIAYTYGRVEDYRQVEPELRRIEAAGIRLSMTVGNHDHRSSFLEVWPELAKRSPVANNVASCVSLPHADFILIDTLNETAKPGDWNVGTGSLNPEMQDWMVRNLPGWPRPFFVGGHHSHKQLSCGTGKGRPLRQLFAKCPNFRGYFHGHDHFWNSGVVDWRSPDARPFVCLPSSGLWGDIGYVALRVERTRAVATLVEEEFFCPKPVPATERNPLWVNRIAALQGRSCAFSV